MTLLKVTASEPKLDLGHRLVAMYVNLRGGEANLTNVERLTLSRIPEEEVRHREQYEHDMQRMREMFPARRGEQAADDIQPYYDFADSLKLKKWGSSYRVSGLVNKWNEHVYIHVSRSEGGWEAEVRLSGITRLVVRRSEWGKTRKDALRTAAWMAKLRPATDASLASRQSTDPDADDYETTQPYRADQDYLTRSLNNRAKHIRKRKKHIDEDDTTTLRDEAATKPNAEDVLADTHGHHDELRHQIHLRDNLVPIETVLAEAMDDLPPLDGDVAELVESWITGQYVGTPYKVNQLDMAEARRMKQLYHDLNFMFEYNGPIYRSIEMPIRRFEDLMDNGFTKLRKATAESWSANPTVASTFLVPSPRRRKTNVGVMFSRGHVTSGSLILDVYKFLSAYEGIRYDDHSPMGEVNWIKAAKRTWAKQCELILEQQCERCSIAEVELVYIHPHHADMRDRYAVDEEPVHGARVFSPVYANRKWRLEPVSPKPEMLRGHDWNRLPQVVQGGRCPPMDLERHATGLRDTRTY